VLDEDARWHSVRLDARCARAAGGPGAAHWGGHVHVFGRSRGAGPAHGALCSSPIQCSIDPITASSFSSSRKSRSSYPYKLSKPVFGPRPDYNLKVSWQLSRRLRLALVFLRNGLFFHSGLIFGRGASFRIVAGHRLS